MCCWVCKNTIKIRKIILKINNNGLSFSFVSGQSHKNKNAPFLKDAFLLNEYDEFVMRRYSRK